LVLFNLTIKKLLLFCIIHRKSNHINTYIIIKGKMRDLLYTYNYIYKQKDLDGFSFLIIFYKTTFETIKIN
jgi:hypothetical protein